MASLTDQTFRNVRLRASQERFSFQRCTFEACSISVVRDATTRLIVSDGEIIDCKIRGGGLRGIHLRDITARNLRFFSAPQILGCVFEHVTLGGKMNQLIINGELPTVDDPDLFEESARAAYRTIDWAIDISELDCPDLSVRGIPGRLIKRDRQRQLVVTREQALAAPWQEADLRDTNFAAAIDQMLEQGWPEIVLSASRAGPHAERTQSAIQSLIAIGLS